MQSTSRAEAERLLGIAEKLLQGKDLTGARDFALLAQETEPLLDGSDQILAIIDVLIAADKRINNHHDWYAVLQLDIRRYDDDDLIRQQYRRLALLLQPEKNKFAFAGDAFKLVGDAWAVLSDSERKASYDQEYFAFSKVDLVAMKKQREIENDNHRNPREKMPVRRSSGDRGAAETPPSPNIWAACPYCYNLYEYPRVYEGFCLRCLNCHRAFQAVAIPPASLPPSVPGKEAYYCCLGQFPMGFAAADSETAKSARIPNWMPPMFPTKAAAWPAPDSLPNGSSVPLAEAAEGFVTETPPQGPPKPKPKPQQQQQQPQLQRKPAPPTAGATVPRKRGRPRKNPLP